MSAKIKKYDQEFKDNAAKYRLEKAKSITQGEVDFQFICSFRTHFEVVRHYNKFNISTQQKANHSIVFTL